METRHIFRKKERKSSSKHETEWDNQLPSRFLCRTSFKVIIKSSEVKKEIKVIRNHQSPLMSSNRVNHEKNGQGNEANSENDKTARTQRSNQDSKTASLLSLSNESSTEKLKTSGRSSSNFSEPESSVENERGAKNSDGSQLPEHSQNSHSCNVNGKAAMGESGLFPNKFMDPKSNFYNKSNFSLSSSKDHSSRKYPKDFSPLKMNSYILIDTQKNDLSGGDYVQSESEDRNRATIPGNRQLNKLSRIFLISDKVINNQKAAPPTEESAYSETSLKNDNFLSKSFNINNEVFKDSDNIHLLESQHQMLIDKESDSSSSKSFICQETNVKHSWMSNFPVVGDTHNDYNDFSGLNFKLASNKQEDTSPKEGFEFQKVPFKSCRTLNKNTYSKSSCRSEINSDRDFISQNKKRKRILNSIQSSDHSSASFDLNHEFNTEKKELSNDPLYAAHKTISSNNDFDLFKKSKYFSHPDSSDKISSVSSNLSPDGESYQHSKKNFHSAINNSTCKLMDNTGISLACPTSDSHQDLKGIYFLSKLQVKYGQESDSSEGGGSVGFDTRTQEFMMQSAEGSSLNTDTENESATTLNTHHSGEDSDRWKISVSELVEYFENLNSETDMQEKKTKTELLVQINFPCNGGEGINKNFPDSNKNKRKLTMEKGCLNNGKDGKDYVTTFNFDNNFQSKSSDLLYHKEARRMGKCGPVDAHDKNKDDLMDCTRKYGFHHIDKLKEPASVHNVSKVDLLHFSKSKSNIPLLQSQSLEFETEHLKESTALRTADNNTQTDNEKLASDLPEIKRLLPESSRDLRYEEHESSSSKGFSDPETARDGSFEIHKEAPEDRFQDLDITFEPSGENSLEKKEPLSDQKFPTMKMTSNKKQNHMESKPVDNLETRRKVQSWSIYNPLQKPKIYDPDSVSNSLHRLKVNRQIIVSSGNEKNESNSHKVIINSSYISKRVVFLNQNSSDLPLENTFSEDSSNKSAKSSGSVEKSSANQVLNSNQRSFFSRWRVMALIIVLIVVAIDWKNLLERR